MIVPRKRAALLVDRLMVALQKAIEEEEQANRELEAGIGKSKAYGIRPEDAVRSVRSPRYFENKFKRIFRDLVQTVVMHRCVKLWTLSGMFLAILTG
ncbi:hypothetical protein Trydic_g6976, partial [Trypoxylus dichotomus]